MNGIASLLDENANSRVEAIWQELETRCGLKGVRMTPFPHITLQITEGYELPRLKQILKKFARQTQPFLIHTDGLGIFSGENPVVYISVFKDEFLMRFHASVWEQTQGFAQGPDLQYAPPKWVPHITLVYNDLTRQNLDCAMQTLAFQKFDWEIEIDNFILFSQTDGRTDESVKYQLGV